jgi:hypothetical protein
VLLLLLFLVPLFYSLKKYVRHYRPPPSVQVQVASFPLLYVRPLTPRSRTSLHLSTRSTPSSSSRNVFPTVACTDTQFLTSGHSREHALRNGPYPRTLSSTCVSCLDCCLVRFLSPIRSLCLPRNFPPFPLIVIIACRPIFAGSAPVSMLSVWLRLLCYILLFL